MDETFSREGMGGRRGGGDLGRAGDTHFHTNIRHHRNEAPGYASRARLRGPLRPFGWRLNSLYSNGPRGSVPYGKHFRFYVLNQLGVCMCVGGGREGAGSSGGGEVAVIDRVGGLLVGERRRRGRGQLQYMMLMVVDAGVVLAAVMVVVGGCGWLCGRRDWGWLERRCKDDVCTVISAVDHEGRWIELLLSIYVRLELEHCSVRMEGWTQREIWRPAGRNRQKGSWVRVDGWKFTAEDGRCQLGSGIVTHVTGNVQCMLEAEVQAS